MATKIESVDLVIVMDLSSSMEWAIHEVRKEIHKLVTMFKRMKSVSTYLTVYTFDTGWRRVVRRVPVSEVEGFSLMGGGYTALFDCFANAVLDTEKEMRDGESDKIMLVLFTDGEDNSSEEWTEEKIKEMIRLRSNWDFICFAIGDDTAVHKRLGFNPSKSIEVNSYDESLRHGMAAVRKNMKSVVQSKATFNFDEEQRERAGRGW